MWSRSSHGRRIAAITVIGTAIVLPLVVFVLGPNMPPGKATEVAKGQVTDNTVLLVVMTPFTVFILGYLGYAIWVFRAPKGETELKDGAPIRGHMPSQIAWLVTTTIAVLFLAIFGTTELLANNGAGSGSGPNPVDEAERRFVLPVQVIGQQWEFTYRYPTYGGVETAQLVLPVGRQVAFHVTSLDAVHSFWAYELGVKADANPGRRQRRLRQARRRSARSRSAAPSSAVSGTATCSTPAALSATPTSRRGSQRGSSSSPASRSTCRSTAPSYAPDPHLPRRMNLRRLFGFNLLSAVVLGVVGFYVGWWLGHQITGPSIAYFSDTGQNDIALFVAYLVGVIGFLVGLGLRELPGAAACSASRRPCGRRSSRGSARYFGLCTDHKVVGIQYLLGIGAFIFIGGLNAMLIRFELMRPQHLVWNGNNYLTLVGVHGTMMMGMMTSGILGPFANYFVPLMIGARRMAFPRIEALTFWLLMAAGTILMTSWVFGGFPTGWTGYAPLNEQANMGIDAYIAFFALVGLSMTLLGLNMLATVITMRAPGMTWGRLPIFVWATVSTSVLMLLAAPVLISTLLMLTLDRTAQTSFFNDQTGGSPYLYENLFWFFGHPEVYILAHTRGWAILLEILPVFSRKPLWGYRLAVTGMLGIALLSFLVWQHHLFVSGINADVRPVLHALDRDHLAADGLHLRLRARDALEGRTSASPSRCSSALAWLFNFLIGGLSGVFLSDVPSDVTTHGSFFSMAHFHYTIMGGLLFAFFAGIYYWVPKMTGYNFNERLGKWHFWVMFIAFNSTFGPLLVIGFLGMPRRVVTYAGYLQGANVWVSISAFVLGGSMLIFLANLVWSQVFARVPTGHEPVGLEVDRVAAALAGARCTTSTASRRSAPTRTRTVMTPARCSRSVPVVAPARPTP